MTYNQAFKETLASLNKEQLRAVNQIEGTVLAIAGPGTGKTHILSARIGQILTLTDTQPHNILCLTYTDAGVRAMRERLIKLIGPDAHKVHIFTFHSFCNNIIQKYPDLFGKQDLEPLSNLEKIEVCRSIIDSLNRNHPLVFGRGGGEDVYYYETHLNKLFSLIKKEDWTIEQLDTNIRDYLKTLDQRPEYRYKSTKKGLWTKGELIIHKIEDEQQKMNRLLAALPLYPLYLQKMKELGRYDFDDMIMWVVSAFKQHPFLLRNYQEQYLYFLVDEYQDTNGAQNEILEQLVAYWENPNIFIVGDDDQSIYEFQGARLKSLSDFYLRYQSEITLVLLEENYRSSTHILDIAQKLIQRNKQRIVNLIDDKNLSKQLIAKNPKVANTTIKPYIAIYENRLQEEIDIVKSISDFPKSEIAIIYAQHKQANGIIALLEKKGNPLSNKKRSQYSGFAHHHPNQNHSRIHRC